jgi:uncharacterized protein YprB with RNaseH-like and TPR domain
MLEHEKRLEFRCGHRHNGYEHTQCYMRAHHKEEKIGFLDIETEDLRADYGIIFGYCIKDATSDKIWEDCITKEDITKFRSTKRDVIPWEDKRVLESLIRDMGRFTRLVGHYSSRFDMPYIRTRAVMCGLQFPTFGSFVQTDTWMILKNKFKLSRNSLQNSCQKLVGMTEKDHLSLSIKHGCLRGEEWALKDTMKHCRQDVRDTERLYNLIYSYAKETKSSI